MNCLKCGKKTKGNQVFCSDCLETMEAYPVKPDVHIQLPNRTRLPAVKKSWRKRKNLTKEEQLARLRIYVRRLVALVLLLTVLLCVTVAMLLHNVLKPDTPDLGKNYTVDSTMD